MKLKCEIEVASKQQIQIFVDCYSCGVIQRMPRKDKMPYAKLPVIDTDKFNYGHNRRDKIGEKRRRKPIKAK